MPRFVLPFQEREPLALAVVPLKPRPNNVADYRTDHFISPLHFIFAARGEILRDIFTIPNTATLPPGVRLEPDA